MENSVFSPVDGLNGQDDLVCTQFETSTTSTLFSAPAQPTAPPPDQTFQHQSEFIRSKPVGGNARNSHFFFCDVSEVSLKFPC